MICPSQTNSMRGAQRSGHSEELKTCCQLKRGNRNFCCINPPLLNVPFDHVILDELHLFLRITDVLTRNVLDEMIELDDEESHKRKVANPSVIGQHLQTAIEAINKCGVTFWVWEKKNADGKGSGTYDWTSLMGNEKRLLLKTFPEHFPSILRPITQPQL